MMALHTFRGATYRAWQLYQLATIHGLFDLSVRPSPFGMGGTPLPHVFTQLGSAVFALWATFPRRRTFANVIDRPPFIEALLTAEPAPIGTLVLANKPNAALNANSLLIHI